LPISKDPGFLLLGSRLRPLATQEAVSEIIRAARDRRGGHVCLSNVHTITLGRTDIALRKATNTAMMALADGRPLVWAAHLCGMKQAHQVRGADLMRETCRAAAGEHLPVFFYGGASGVATKVARSLEKECPGLVVAGCDSPPFLAERPVVDGEAVKRIQGSGARILWVGLGAPKQENWMLAHHDLLSNMVMVGVGAAFDFQAGTVKEAPRWIQRTGMEWGYRLVQNPGRLWRRYMYFNALFLIHTGFQVVGIRTYRSEAAGQATWK
jgi:N-acetylglucosaminyldiphosphoundecaprenol N-acetyl-beta-D-mannosaminyltransferase